jgi:hypothetical protein
MNDELGVHLSDNEAQLVRAFCKCRDKPIPETGPQLLAAIDALPPPLGFLMYASKKYWSFAPVDTQRIRSNSVGVAFPLDLSYWLRSCQSTDYVSNSRQESRETYCTILKYALEHPWVSLHEKAFPGMYCRMFLDVDSPQNGIFQDPKKIALVFQKTLEAIAPESIEYDYHFKASVLCLKNDNQENKFHFISNVGLLFDTPTWKNAWNYLVETLTRSGIIFDAFASKNGQLRFELFL